MRAVIGNEIQAGAVRDERARGRISDSQSYVFHQHCSRTQAIRLPQFNAADAVIGGKEKRAIHIDELSGRGACSTGSNILDKNGSTRTSIGFPKFTAIYAVECRIK